MYIVVKLDLETGKPLGIVSIICSQTATSKKPGIHRGIDVIFSNTLVTAILHDTEMAAIKLKEYIECFEFEHDNNVRFEVKKV